MYRLTITIFAISLLFLGSCNKERKKSPLPDATHGVNLSANTIESNILALASQDWNPGTYGEILHNQIESGSEITDADRTALTKMLREAYTDQIIRCADSIMLKACAPSHDKLKGMVDSLAVVTPLLSNDYRKKEIADINSRYATHKKMMAFSVSGVYSKTVTAESQYDSSYDRERRATAASFRKTSPTCATIKKKIDSSAVESALNRRKADFQKKLEKKRAESSL